MFRRGTWGVADTLTGYFAFILATLYWRIADGFATWWAVGRATWCAAGIATWITADLWWAAGITAVFRWAAWVTTDLCGAAYFRWTTNDLRWATFFRWTTHFWWAFRYTAARFPTFSKNQITMK